MNRIAKILLASAVLGTWYLAVHRPGPALRTQGHLASPDRRTDSLAAIPARAGRAELPHGLAAVTAAPPQLVAEARSRMLVRHDVTDAEEEAHDRSELGSWRHSWSRETQDDEWTRHTFHEVAAKAADLAGKVVMTDLSCRETTCRFYLQFADQLDAQAYIDAPPASNLDYKYNSLDPRFDGAGFDSSDHTYEVFIRRARPDHLPQHDVADDHQEAVVESAALPNADGEDLRRVVMPPSEATAIMIDRSLQRL